MKKLLIKLGLFDSFSIELLISIQDLINGLARKTDNWRPDIVNMFEFNKREYKGSISESGFKLMKTKTNMMSFEPSAQAIGEIVIDNDRAKLLVKVNIQSDQAYTFTLSLGVLTVFFFLIGLGVLIYSILDRDFNGVVSALGVWAFVSVFVGVPLWFMRWSVRTLKCDIREELETIERKNVAQKKI